MVSIWTGSLTLSCALCLCNDGSFSLVINNLWIMSVWTGCDWLLNANGSWCLVINDCLYRPSPPAENSNLYYLHLPSGEWINRVTS